MRPPDLPTLRAALWTVRALRRTRRALRREPVDEIRVLPPPVLPRSARRGVRVVLSRTRRTCLERSLVLQAWEASQGEGRAVLIGVKGSGEALEAHAWLEGERDGERLAFRELYRVPAR